MIQPNSLLQSDDKALEARSPITILLIILCINTVQFSGDLNHVTVCRQRLESDSFVFLARSCDQYSTAKGRSQPRCPPSSPLQTDTERVCYQRNKGQCTVSSHSQLTRQILEEKKRAANKTSFVSTKTSRRLLLRPGL